MTTATNRTAWRVNRQHRSDRKWQGVEGLVPGSEVAAHLRTCIAAGWTQLGIADASHVSNRAIRYILAGQTKVQRDNALRLLAIKPEDSPRVPALGIARRIRALARIGYTIQWTADQVGCSNRHIYEILNGTVDAVERSLADRFTELYRKHEATPGPSRPAQIAATSKGWAGPDGWDADSIDDPEAHPDWTGYCGTDRGWWTHRLEQIPVCQPCDMAHDQWKQERAHLTSKERWAELARARAAAASREANLAEDARELMRLDIPVDVIAGRLGVTKQHLQQAMLRHPAQQDMEAAA